MKTGFNLLLWTTHLTDDLLPVCEDLKAAGYDGVEVPIFEGDVAHYTALKGKLNDIGLQTTAVSIVQSADANPCSPDADSRARHERRVRDDNAIYESIQRLEDHGLDASSLRALSERRAEKQPPYIRDPETGDMP